MTKETDYLIQSLFEHESLEEMTLDDFKRVADQFPYSSIIQFLYSCKLKSVYHLDFPNQVTHTALFFSSPQWLHYQLGDESEKGDFRLNSYDKYFNDVTEDQPIAAADQSFEEEEYEDNLWEESIEDENALIEHESSKASVNNDTNSQEILNPDQTIPLNDIPIEPYHTIDYFASQGIKTRLDDPQDELGKKVRTFTAWLKTMKRLQPAAEINEIEENDEEIDNGLDQPVSREIIATEAMAEVYLKQGLTQKAIEVYAKLSLQNPANSHIFAAKIIQIKENSI